MTGSQWALRGRHGGHGPVPPLGEQRSCISPPVAPRQPGPSAAPDGAEQRTGTVMMGCHTRVTSVGGLSRSPAGGGSGVAVTARGDGPASARHRGCGTERDVSNHSTWKRSRFYIC